MGHDSLEISLEPNLSSTPSIPLPTCTALDSSLIEIRYERFTAYIPQMRCMVLNPFESMLKRLEMW